MAPKSVVGPLFSDDMEHQEPDDPDATEIEEEEIGHYGSERLFPFPARRVIQEELCWASSQNNLKESGSVVSVRVRRKNVISRRSTAVRKQYKVNSVGHSVVNRIAISVIGVDKSGKRGEIIVSGTQQHFATWRNNSDAPWRS